jgi:hypothetical protein
MARLESRLARVRRQRWGQDAWRGGVWRRAFATLAVLGFLF